MMPRGIYQIDALPVTRPRKRAKITLMCANVTGVTGVTNKNDILMRERYIYL